LSATTEDVIFPAVSSEFTLVNIIPSSRLPESTEVFADRPCCTKQDAKTTSPPDGRVVGSGCSRWFRARLGQIGQGFDRHDLIILETVRIAGRQPGIGMAGQILCGFEVRAGAADVRDERVPQGVQIRVSACAVHFPKEVGRLTIGSVLIVNGF